MSTREELLASIADTIKDYRAGELPQPTPAHVNRWINQFDADSQLPMLAELDQIFNNTYFSKDNVSDFFEHQIKHDKLAGSTPAAFWQTVNFLNIQKNGDSQKEILALFGASLAQQFNVNIATCGSSGGTFFYLDDVLFSGTRISIDLCSWIEKTAPQKATVNILVIAAYTYGEWSLLERLSECATKNKKNIKFSCWALYRLQNKKSQKDESEVFWPAVIQDDSKLKAYMAKDTKFPLVLRNVIRGASSRIFSSESGRQVLERELLLAGVKILSGCHEPKSIIRPLGFSHFGVGFGSTVVTYRNCPNNCPLAFWWGESGRSIGSTPWYPLLPRKTYAHNAGLASFPHAQGGPLDIAALLRKNIKKTPSSFGL